MEQERIAGLTAELTAQMRLIERIYQRLDNRLSLGLETPAQLDSVAYQIHNLYCAVEDLLKLVASAFENSIGSSSEWHRTILLRLSQPVQGIRPALLSEETFDVLNRLRGFRHFVRHAYGAEVEITQLRTNLDLSFQLKPLLTKDIQLFLAQMSPTET
jgi:uncharacterized protein YutE (UPF0331/DUF86 family)